MVWKSISSLQSIALEFVANGLTKHRILNRNKHLEELEYLPDPIKNRILKTLTIRPSFIKSIENRDVLSKLLNGTTQCLDLTSISLDTNFLKALKKCRKLCCLHLTNEENNAVIQDDLHNLFKNSPHLEVLTLTHFAQVLDDSLSNLVQNCSSLKAIDLSGCTNITDDGLKELAKLSGLTWIKLSNTNITDTGVARLVQSENSTRIKELRLDGCSKITEIGLKMIVEHCSKIEVLIFNNCNKNAGDGIANFDADIFRNLKQITWTIL